MREPKGMHEMIEENLQLAKDNNRLLRKIRRNAVWGGILKLVWWAFILGVPVYLYFTIFQPYLEDLSQTYQGIQGNVEELQRVPQELRELLNNIPGFGSIFSGESKAE